MTLGIKIHEKSIGDIAQQFKDGKHILRPVLLNLLSDKSMTLFSASESEVVYLVSEAEGFKMMVIEPSHKEPVIRKTSQLITLNGLDLMRGGDKMNYSSHIKEHQSFYNKLTKLLIADTSARAYLEDDPYQDGKLRAVYFTSNKIGVLIEGSNSDMKEIFYDKAVVMANAKYLTKPTIKIETGIKTNFKANGELEIAQLLFNSFQGHEYWYLVEGIKVNPFGLLNSKLKQKTTEQ